MADNVHEIITRSIQLADQIIKEADFACLFKQECADVKSKTERLGGLLRQLPRASSYLYERPTRLIIDNSEQVLDKTLQLVLKCRVNAFQRLFTFIDADSIRKSSNQIEKSIGDVSWLLRVASPADERDDEYIGMPPISADEPVLYLIWEQIMILSCGSLNDRANAAAALVSFAQDNERYVRLIIEEGGVPPLLKLAKQGSTEGQESAIHVIRLLGYDPESIEQIY